MTVDGHNDTPVERIHRGEAPLKWKQRDLAYNMDIPRMVEGGFNAGFFVVGNGPTANIRVIIERTLSQIEAYPSDLLLVLSSEDIEQARATGKVGILMTIEGAGRWLEGEEDILRLYYRFGVRCVGLTHGEGGNEPIYLQGTKSPFGFCTAADREAERKNAGGLTPSGKTILQTSNEMGIVTNLFHANDKAFYEAVERSSRPLTMTHMAVFSLYSHWRCLTDDQIVALADAGGIVGIAFAPPLSAPRIPLLIAWSNIYCAWPETALLAKCEDRAYQGPSQKKNAISTDIEYICYVVDLVGIKHVAIGSDFDGLGQATLCCPSGVGPRTSHPEYVGSRFIGMGNPASLGQEFLETLAANN